MKRYLPVNEDGFYWGPIGPDFIPPCQQEVADCKRFFEKMVIVKSNHVGSYQLKHVIERWAGRYVTNGACIAAAIELSVPVSVDFTTGSYKNARIGISRRVLNRLIKEMASSGGGP